MGEGVERARPPERDGAGEHGPQCEEQNGRQCPEFVTSSSE